MMFVPVTREKAQYAYIGGVGEPAASPGRAGAGWGWLGRLGGAYWRGLFEHVVGRYLVSLCIMLVVLNVAVPEHVGKFRDSHRMAKFAHMPGDDESFF